VRSRYGYGALDGCIGNGTIWLVYRITWYSVTTDIAIPRTTTVLLPYRYVIQNDVLAHTWDVTSDTVAAWAAGNLSLDLHLLKSVDGIFINGVLRKLVTTPVESDVSIRFLFRLS
jgi:aspartokinase-like uncharacterized kinase